MESTWKAKRQKIEQEQKLVEAKEAHELNEIILNTYRKYKKEPKPKRRFDLEKPAPEVQKLQSKAVDNILRGRQSCLNLTALRSQKW